MTSPEEPPSPAFRPSTVGSLGYGERYATDQPEEVALPWLGWAIIVTAVLTSLAALLPWARIPLLSLVISGTDLGKLLALLPILVALIGVLVLLRWGTLWVCIAAVAFSACELMLVFVESVGLTADQATEHQVSPDDVALAYGLWVTLFLAAVCLICCVWALSARQAKPRSQLR
ncbi:hypothetical protein SAMN05444157_1363 [Frankineae bacterium MT45]|nr:hypothetical protein SAMN05444157_1363 [Frankineae bacterium MT45]